MALELFIKLFRTGYDHMRRNEQRWLDELCRRIGARISAARIQTLDA